MARGKVCYGECQGRQVIDALFRALSAVPRTRVLCEDNVNYCESEAREQQKCAP